MATSHMKIKRQARIRRHRRVRARIIGTASRPRLSVFRSAKHIYAQLIDDTTGKTIVAVSDITKTPGTKKTKRERAAEVGSAIAKAAIGKGITKVVFDRGGFAYHGRVKELAEAARKEGLKF